MDLTAEDSQDVKPAKVRDNRSRKKKKRRKPKVFGDSAYGSGEFQQHLEDHGIDSGCKTQKPSPPPGGLFAKDQFTIDLDADTVTCPNAVTVTIRRGKTGKGHAAFAENCTACPLRTQCTTSKAGRRITIGVNEAALGRARKRQTDPAWRDDYRSTRPRSNASSATSCATVTAAAAPE